MTGTAVIVVIIVGIVCLAAGYVLRRVVGEAKISSAEQEAAKVVEEGAAYDLEEQQKGVCAIAVPVFERGDVALALGVVVPVERFAESDVERLRRELTIVAGLMGARLEKAAYAWREALVT